MARKKKMIRKVEKKKRKQNEMNERASVHKERGSVREREDE